MIRVENVSFAYSKGTEILHHISLGIRENEVVVILGPNGCGKSTLLNMILGLKKPKNGEIYIEEKSIADYTPVEFAKKVSYVPQLSNVDLSFRVLDYMCFARNAHLEFYKLPSAVDYHKVEDCARLCNIEYLLYKSMNQLSGGEKQLVSIAKALVQDTPIIIMDEPTSALDYGNQKRFLDLVRKLHARGKTIIFTTHNPDFPKLLNSYVIMLKNGIVFSQGKSGDVLNTNNIECLYN